MILVDADAFILLLFVAIVLRLTTTFCVYIELFLFSRPRCIQHLSGFLHKVKEETHLPRQSFFFL